MTNRERESKTLSFESFEGRGSVEETFYPWNITINRFIDEGLPEEYRYSNIIKPIVEKSQRYVNSRMANGVNEYEGYLGFDSVKRFGFTGIFKCFDEEILDEDDTCILKLCADGWTRKFYKQKDLVEEIKPVVRNWEDWTLLKEKVLVEFNKFVTDEAINKVYLPFKEEHKNGDYSIRFRILGYFWIPRDLLGIENHMITFYDNPELIHDINSFATEVYLKYLDKIFNIVSPDVLLICEDLSGANGPMLSPLLFDEFVGQYYRKLIPFLRGKGVKNVFVDTDGDFTILASHFIKAGIDGFLPLDVNAGIDIVKLRDQYPNLKFIGGFNKLAISKGKKTIDEEFDRILPVIRQGGYIPGADHQVAPSTSLLNYKYYIQKLKEVMKQSGKIHL